MGIGLIREKNLFVDILNKYNIDFTSKNDVVIIEYNGDSVRLICSFFEFGKKIYIDKFDDKFSFVINKCDFSRDLFDNLVVSNDLLVKFLDIISKCRMIKLSVKKDDGDILLDLFSSQYSGVFDECLIKNNNYYFVSKSNIFSLEQELNIYNKLFSPIDIKISRVEVVSDFFVIEKYYHRNDVEKVIIFNNSDTIDLIMVSDINIKFVFRNKKNFERVILPEVLKMCIYKISSLDNEVKLNYFNKMSYMIDNQLYMLNFYDEVLESNIQFLYNLISKKKYQLQLNSDIMFGENDDSNNINVRKSYSYGYVNVLLISFILSVVTIVVCLLKI